MPPAVQFTGSGINAILRDIVANTPSVEKEKLVIAGGAIVCVEGTLFLLASDRNLGRLQVQNHPRCPLVSFGLCNQFPTHGRRASEVRSLRRHLSFESAEPRWQDRTAVANLLRTNRAKSGILTRMLGVIRSYLTPFC